MWLMRSDWGTSLGLLLICLQTFECYEPVLFFIHPLMINSYYIIDIAVNNIREFLEYAGYW